MVFVVVVSHFSGVNFKPCNSVLVVLALPLEHFQSLSFELLKVFKRFGQRSEGFIQLFFQQLQVLFVT